MARLSTINDYQTIHCVDYSFFRLPAWSSRRGVVPFTNRPQLPRLKKAVEGDIKCCHPKWWEFPSPSGRTKAPANFRRLAQYLHHGSATRPGKWWDWKTNYLPVGDQSNFQGQTAVQLVGSLFSHQLPLRTNATGSTASFDAQESRLDNWML